MVTGSKMGKKGNNLIEFFRRAEHKIYKTIKRIRLKNKTLTVFSSNCNGGYILHDLGLPFNSPTINLFFLPDHFLKFAGSPETYLSAELKETQIEGIAYPVGQLKDILLFFMHYHSFDEAKQAWERRSKRVNMDNVYILMTDKNGCTYEHIKRFEELPYKNKVIFTHKKYEEFPSSFYISGFETENEVGILSDFKPQFLKRRWLDEFDYVRFFNQGKSN